MHLQVEFSYLLRSGSGPCNGREAVQDHLPLVGEAVRYQEAEGSGDVANELGPIYGHDTETLERIYSRWFLLSLDGKQRIYHSWTTNEKQTSLCHTKARE